MSERPPLETPDSLQSDLQYVDFGPKRTDPTSGFVTYEGSYTNAEQQRFVLILTAPKDDRYLERYRDELLVAFLARPEGAPPQAEHAEKHEGVRKSLVELIEEGVREEGGDAPVLGLEVRCDSLPNGARRRKRPELVTVIGYIDPWIGKDHRHCYQGPDRVRASAIGKVTLGGLTGDPKATDVPPTRDRDANRACWVRGVALKSNYHLNAEWDQVPC
jgi:hypothetical protein